jgi:hypothetical protein
VGLVRENLEQWATLSVLFFFFAVPGNFLQSWVCKLVFLLQMAACSLGFWSLGHLSNKLPVLVLSLRIIPISAFRSNTTCVSFAISKILFLEILILD